MGSIAVMDLILYDQWPGVADPNLTCPTVGFDTTTAGCKAADGSPTWPVGTKIIGYQDATAGAGASNVANTGYYMMIYLKYWDYCSAGDTSAGTIVALTCLSAQLSELACTGDISGIDSTAGAPAAVACASIAATEYGWFWCGGICPNYDVTTLDETGILTDGAAAQGHPLTLDNDVSHPIALALDTSDCASVVVGYALRDDT